MVLHVTSFARIAILDLVLGFNFTRIHGILITFPIAVIVHFLLNCEVITGFLFIGIFTEKIEWCEEDRLSYFVASMSTRNQSILQERLNAERTTPVKIEHQCPWLARKETLTEFDPRRASLMNVETSLCLRNLVLPVLRTLSAVLALPICNHFGDRCWKRSSSVRWFGRNIFHFLSVVGWFFLCTCTLVWKKR